METRELILKNRVGKRMPATLRLPEGSPKATALILHGLGGWRYQSPLVDVAEALYTQGYAVLMFDGSDAADGPDGDFFVNTNTGYVEDTEDVVAWMKTQDWYTVPFVLMGHSQGGLVAVRYTRMHPVDVSKLVLAAPAVSWYSGLWMYWPFALAWLVTGSSWWLGPNGRKLSLGRKWLFDFFNFDGYADARLVHVPTLIISAEKDVTVGKPFIHRSFAKHFQKGTWKMIKKAHHSFPEHGKELADTITAWLTSS